MELIASEKVKAAYQIIREPVIAQDAGFYVHSLNGFPRAFVNFVLETIGVDGILKQVAGLKRECEFRSVLAYYDGRVKEPVLFQSRTEGTLAEEKRGQRADYFWSDLFFVFIPVNESKTLAEMTWDEYQKWREMRMRHSFATSFAEWYLKQP